MAFDPIAFEAEVALKLIPTEKLPSAAQDALEAGFDGAGILRMAILDPTAFWEVDQALPLMLVDLGCQAISPEAAALRLARQRARRLLESGEDPLPRLSYFALLRSAGNRPVELSELAFFEDYGYLYPEDPEKKRARAREALEELLYPEL